MHADEGFARFGILWILVLYWNWHNAKQNIIHDIVVPVGHHYLAPGGSCEVLFSPGLSVCVCVCVSVCLCVCVSGRYFGILFLGY